jgi:hypothetical protein
MRYFETNPPRLNMPGYDQAALDFPNDLAQLGFMT